MKKIKKILLFTLSWLVPKKHSYWLFIPTHYKTDVLQGNMGAVLNYVTNHNAHGGVFECINIPEKEFGKNSHYDFLFSGFYVLKNFLKILRAEVVFIDSGDYIPGRFKIVQLWHGSGFKNIGKLNEHKKKRKNKKLFYSFDRVEKKKGKQIILAIASSAKDAEQKKTSFVTDNVFITGSPINDKLLNHADSDVKTLLGYSEYEKIISYAPTYREGRGFKPFSKDFVEKLDQWLQRNRYLFLIRNHPLDKSFKLDSEYKNVVDVTTRSIPMDKFLLTTDLLISDYSSISTDFSLLQRPMIFYTYDIEEYQKFSRSFYYDLTEIVPKPVIDNERELLEYLFNFNDWNKFSDEQKHFSKKFHQYRDSNSSKRVVNTLIELLY